MPLFAFRCPEGHTSEALRRIEDREKPQECPECGRSCVPILTAPSQIRFGIPGVKGHYRASTTQLSEIDGR